MATRGPLRRSRPAKRLLLVGLGLVGLVGLLYLHPHGGLSSLGFGRTAELEENVRILQETLDSVSIDREMLLQAAAERDELKQKMVAERKEFEQKLAAASKAAVCTDRHLLLGPSKEKDKTDPEFAAFLKKVANNDHEVLVAVSNANYAWPGGMLELWVTNVRKAGVKNAMVIALDDDTKKNMDALNFPAFRMDLQIPDSQKEVGTNHAVSALKFRILKKFLSLGYSVFMSDVDIVVLQDPFKFLTRDSDVESMSDGWDPPTAYGYNDVADDPSMGWARYAHSMRVFCFNSGLFYIRSTKAAMDLLDMVINRVETEKGWDQAIFNEAIFFPSRPGFTDPSVTRRVLDYMLFMNSKVLFKQVRHDPNLANHRPVTIHVNYHPDKFERMKAIVSRYVDGDMHALDKFPDGSEH